MEGAYLFYLPMRSYAEHQCVAQCEDHFDQFTEANLKWSFVRSTSVTQTHFEKHPAPALFC